VDIVVQKRRSGKNLRGSARARTGGGEPIAARGPTPTLRALIEDFMTAVDLERGLSPHTCDAYRSDCELFAKTLPPALQEQPTLIEERHVFDFMVAERHRGQHVLSVRRRISALRTFFRYLIGQGIVTEDPTRYLESPQSGVHLPKVLQIEEVDRLMHAIDEHPSRYRLRDKSLLELLYATGMRVGEAIALTLPHIYFDLGVIRCFGKGARERIVPASVRALGYVEEYIADERPRLVRTNRSDVVFLSRSGKPLGREVVASMIKKYANLAGIGINVSPHILRHSLATHLIRRGADLRVVQEILGHVRVETTEIYTHLNRDDLKRAHQQFHPRP